MQLKLFATIERFHRWFTSKFAMDDTVFQLLTLEKSFRVQVIVETFFHTLPMIFVISHYSNATEWSGLGKFTVFIMALMLIKNLGILTIFVTQKCIDGHDDPDMRPFTGGAAKMSKIEMEAVNHIKSYLIDPHDDGLDNEGNTTVHQLMRYESVWDKFERQLADFPHHLFMLNKFGQTPLDVAIQESVEATDIAKKMTREKKDKQVEEAYSEVENAREKAQ